MPARTSRENNRPEIKANELDLEAQIRSLLFLAGDERKLLEKFIKEYKFKDPIKDVILSFFEKADYCDTIRCGQVFKLIRTNCIALTSHGLSTRMFAESMKELGFERGQTEGTYCYRFIKLKDLKDVSKRSKNKTDNKTKGKTKPKSNS